MNAKFVHLHVHTEYSLVDGLIQISDLIDATVKFKSAVAITDQCNLFAMVKLYQEAEQKKVKPIIGTDIWLMNEEDVNHPYRLL